MGFKEYAEVIYAVDVTVRLHAKDRAGIRTWYPDTVAERASTALRLPLNFSTVLTFDYAANSF